MDTPNFKDFESAGKAVLAFLHKRLGFDLWMLTRTVGDDWIVLQTEDHGYGVEPGTVFRWVDSFCSQMVQGKGPRIAPNSEAVPAYETALIGQQFQIRSYVGLPIVLADGSLFGTLCAIHPSSQPESILEEQELVEMLGTLLGTLLQAELRADAETRRSELLQQEALTDAQTTLYNRLGWTRMLATEEARCRRYGHPAAILIIDLDKLKVVNDAHGHAAGDDLIVRAGTALKQAARSIDIVARLGGDEFGILSAECDRTGGEALVQRVRAALAEANVQASVGLAMRQPRSGLDGAWEAADHLMYDEKRARRLSVCF